MTRRKKNAMYFRLFEEKKKMPFFSAFFTLSIDCPDVLLSAFALIH